MKVNIPQIVEFKPDTVIYCEKQSDIDKLSKAGLCGPDFGRDIDEYTAAPCYVYVQKDSAGKYVANSTKYEDIALGWSRKDTIDFPSIDEISFKNALLSAYEDKLIAQFDMCLQDVLGFETDSIHVLIDEDLEILFSKHKGYYECLQDLNKIDNTPWRDYVKDFRKRVVERIQTYLNEINKENNEHDYDE